MKRISTILVGIGVCACSFGDVELRYFNKKKDAAVEYATVYVDKDDKKVETIFYAWCGEIADDCNRKNPKAVIRKQVEVKKYLQRQARALGVREKYLLDPDGKKLLEKNLDAATKANNYEYVNELTKQQLQLRKIYDFLPFFKDTQDKELNQGTEPFLQVIRPMEAEKRVDVEAKKNSHIEMATNTEWFLGGEEKVSAQKAVEICKQANGTVPTGVDAHRIKDWAHESPIATWASEFWTGLPVASSSARAVKVYLDPNTYRNDTVYDISVKAPIAKLDSRTPLVLTEISKLVVTSTQAEREAAKYNDNVHMDKFTATASVVCIRKASLED